MAKGIAFSMLFTFVPILMVALWIFSEFLADATALRIAVLNHLLDIVPPAAESFVADRMEAIVVSRAWQQVGIAGVVMLFWAPGSLFAAIEQSLYTIMQTTERRGFWFRHLIYFTLHFLIITIMLLFTLLGLMIDTLIPDQYMPPHLAVAASWLVSLLIVWGSLVAVYRMSFHGRIRLRAIVWTSLGISLLWQGLNSVGSSIIAGTGRNELFYGILAGVAVVMLWAFLFAQMLLLGGIIIARKSQKMHRTLMLDVTRNHV